MTKKEAFIQIIQVGTVEDQAAEMYLLSAGIVAEDDFLGNLDELEEAGIPLLQSLLSISSQSEGSASWSYNRDGIKDRLLFLAKKFGRNDIIDSLKNAPRISKYDWGL